MEIPYHIQNLLERRCDLAEELSSISSQLDTWLEENDIPMGTDYTLSGYMSYCEPYTAKQCVIEDILNKE